MKIPSSQARGKALEIEMTPMIDMVFLLIVFFVWTSGKETPESTLPSQVTTASGQSADIHQTDISPEDDFEPIVIRIRSVNQQPAWFMNEERIAKLSNLQASLAKIVLINRNAPVILHADANVSMQHLIELYDLVRQIGFSKVQFVANAV